MTYKSGYVSLVGKANAGKSTLINALLEKDILPTDVIPTTATLNKVTPTKRHTITSPNG